MTPTQREAALRLAEGPRTSSVLWGRAVAALLRELASEQDDPMPGMSLMNRTIAYCAADTLRKLGYEWNGEAWLAAEPVRECADNDSPWLICKPCAAVGRCAKLPVAWLSRDEARLALWEAIHKRDYGNPTDDKLILEALHKAGFWIGRLVTAEPQAEPVAWRSKERINGEFDSGWKLTSNEPPQTPRTIAIEPLYTVPQQRNPLTDEQVFASQNLMDLNGRVLGLAMPKLMEVIRAVERAHGIGEAP